MVRGGLFVRFLAVVLAAVVLALLYARLVWAPGLVKEMTENQQIEISNSMEVIAAGLVPMLIQQDLSNIYDNLDAILAHNQNWRLLALYSPEGASLYPLEEPEGANMPEHVVLYHHDIVTNDINLGHLDLYFDNSALLESIGRQLQSAYIVLVAALLLVAGAGLILFYRLVTVPTRRLVTAINALAAGNYRAPLATSGSDEIAWLAARFEAMRTMLEQERQQLMRARDVAEQASQAKGHFLANMSHEIRTPMNGVLGMLQLMQSDPLDETQKERVDLAISSGQALLTVINDILDFSKIEAGKLEIDCIDFDFTQLIQEVVGQYRALCDSRELNFVLDQENLKHRILKGDPPRIRQVLNNLIGNAVKFTPAGSVLLVVATEPHSDGIGVTMVIEDTGIGIPSDRLEAIFESFSQADVTTTRRFGGTGLGLSITRQLCQLMGGSVEIESTENEGSTLTVRLVLPEGQASACSSASDLEQQPMNHCCVLLVEDNPVNQKIAMSLLKKFGYITVVAATGKEALRLLNEHQGYQIYQLVLMDCQMPEMDGYEATGRIRNGEAGERYRHVPVIAMTANSMKGDMEKCLAAGMNDYISKPLDVEGFKDVVDRWCSSSADRINQP